jgi:hypothetical protein
MCPGSSLAKATITARSAQSGLWRDLPAQHRNLVPEHLDPSILRGVIPR